MQKGADEITDELLKLGGDSMVKLDTPPVLLCFRCSRDWLRVYGSMAYSVITASLAQ